MNNHNRKYYKSGFLCFALFILTNTILPAQQVISTGGDYFSNQSGSITFTIGEPLIETHASASAILTNGFNQYFLIVTAIDKYPGLEFDIAAFPNPAKETLTLKTGGDARSGLHYIIADINGRLLLSGEITDAETYIDFRNLINGDYILKVLLDDLELKTFKIAKTN